MPQGRRRPMRHYRGSPPCYKDLGSPPKLKASPVQKTREAPIIAGEVAASQKPLGAHSPTHLLHILRSRHNTECKLVLIHSHAKSFMCCRGIIPGSALTSACIKAYTVTLRSWFSGTGAFIPQPFAVTKPIGVYIAPALRANKENDWGSCNPLAGKNLHKAVTLCHVMASKVNVNHYPFHAHSFRSSQHDF